MPAGEASHAPICHHGGGLDSLPHQCILFSVATRGPQRRGRTKGQRACSALVAATPAGPNREWRRSGRPRGAARRHEQPRIAVWGASVAVLARSSARRSAQGWVWA
eukprot:scaffold26302_cov112-Isochrysis_galbana.AAC.6